MSRCLFILCALALGCSPAAGTSDGGDASATDECPHYYINSGVCPDRGLVCHYFEAICYCSADDGMWFCCSNNAIASCPPPSTSPPTNGSACSEIYRDQPCKHDCVDGVATSCSCQGCVWHCTTTACSPDGGTDGGSDGATDGDIDGG
jgi:hypothetical protein